MTLGGIGTAHFGFGSFEELPEWARKFDIYTGLGLGLGIGSGLGIGFAGGGGVSYHFSPNMSVISEVISVSNFGGYGHGVSTIGVQFKL